VWQGAWQGASHRIGSQGRIVSIVFGLMLAVGSGGVALVGCAGPATQVRQQDQAKAMVTEMAQKYWHALRWGELDKAAEFLEGVDARSQMWDYWLSRQGKASLNDSNVYLVKVAPDLRTATISVSYQLMKSNAMTVEERQVKQTWYRSQGRWFLKLTPEELTRFE